MIVKEKKGGQFFELIKGDCLQEIQNIKNNSIDLIVTDPPYKVTTRGGYTSAGGMMLDEKMRKGKVFTTSTFKYSPYTYFTCILIVITCHIF